MPWVDIWIVDNYFWLTTISATCGISYPNKHVGTILRPFIYWLKFWLMQVNRECDTSIFIVSACRNVLLLYRVVNGNTMYGTLCFCQFTNYFPVILKDGLTPLLLTLKKPDEFVTRLGVTRKFQAVNARLLIGAHADPNLSEQVCLVIPIFTD